jgi:hypothetical protein
MAVKDTLDFSALAGGQVWFISLRAGASQADG